MKAIKIKKMLCVCLAALTIIGGMSPAQVMADENDNDSDYGAFVNNDRDIIVDDYNFYGKSENDKEVLAGEKINVQLEMHLADKTGKKKLMQLSLNADQSTAVVTNNEATKVRDYTDDNGELINENTKLKEGFTFTTKDDLTTGYYILAFDVVYGEYVKDESGKNTLVTYNLTKKFNVKINGKTGTGDTEKVDPEAADNDVSIQVAKAPSVKYGESCTISFKANSKYNITSVVPVISETFPFETSGDAYKDITSAGTNSLDCSYKFVARSDVQTGYMPVTFAITYNKGDKSLVANKIINVKCKGKPEAGAGGGGTSEPAKENTPRLMVMGCSTNLEQIYPNDVFTLTVHLKNTAKYDVENIKVTLVSDDKSFVSTSGANSAYIEKIAAGEDEDIQFELMADSSLEAKSYGLSVKTEYEDKAVNQYTSEDTLTISMSLKSEFKLTDIAVPFDLSVGGQSTLNFSVTNTGAATLYNVNVRCEGADFSCEEYYVGNVAPGSNGYASVLLTGEQVTESDGACKIIVTYEDNRGKSYEYSEDTNIYVADMPMEEEFFEDNFQAEPEKKMLVWPYIVGAVVVAGLVVLFVVRAKKKRKQAEEELMDDDI